MFAVVVTTSNISNIGDSVGALCALAREAGLSPLTKFCWWSPSSRSRGCAGAAAGCRTAPGTRRSRTRSASPSWRSRSPTSPAQHQPPYPRRGPDKIFFVIIIEIFFSPHGHRTYFWYLAKIFNGKGRKMFVLPGADQWACPGRRGCTRLWSRRAAWSPAAAVPAPWWLAAPAGGRGGTWSPAPAAAAPAGGPQLQLPHCRAPWPAPWACPGRGPRPHLRRHWVWFGAGFAVA